MDDIALPCFPLFDYWLTFTESNHWSGRWCKPHFGHVYVTMKDEFNWIVLNPRRSRLLVEIAPYPVTDDVPLMIAKPHDTVVKIRFFPRDSIKQHRYISLLNCVTYAKYVIGLPILAPTPYRLYKNLLALTERERMKHRIESIREL